MTASDWTVEFRHRWIEHDDELRKLLTAVAIDQPGPPELVARYLLLWCLPMLDQIPKGHPTTVRWLRAQLAMALATRYWDDLLDEPGANTVNAVRALSRAHTVVATELAGICSGIGDIIDGSLAEAEEGARTGDVSTRCVQVLVLPRHAPGNVIDSGLDPLLHAMTLDDDAEDLLEDFARRRTWAVDFVRARETTFEPDTVRDLIDEGASRLRAVISTIPQGALWTRRIVDFHIERRFFYLLLHEESTSDSYSES